MWTHYESVFGCLVLLSMLTDFSLDKWRVLYGSCNKLGQNVSVLKKTLDLHIYLVFYWKKAHMKTQLLCGKYLQKQTWNSMAEHKPRLPPSLYKFNVCRSRIQCRSEAKLWSKHGVGEWINCSTSLCIDLLSLNIKDKARSHTLIMVKPILKWGKGEITLNISMVSAAPPAVCLW